MGRFLNHTKTIKYLMIAPAVVILALTVGYPLLYTVWLSMHDAKLYNFLSSPPYVGMRNYARVLSDPYFIDSLKRTAIYVGVALTAQFTLGLGIALLLNPIRKAGSLLNAVLVIPIMITPVSVGLMWRFALNDQVGIVRYVLSRFTDHEFSLLGDPSLAFITVLAIEIWWQTPFVLLALLAGLRSLPSEPYEAARIDGANVFQQFLYITLPLLKPILVIILTIRGMDSLKAFDFIYVLTGGGPGAATELASVYLLKASFHSWQLGYGAAVSGIMTLVLLVVVVGIVRPLFLRDFINAKAGDA